jgi:hypothetical protein
VYAKVFSQIFDSSIADDFRLRHFFMDLLVLADVDGVVDMTTTAIAARTRIPLADVTTMLEKLEQPDPESRTPEAQGRRIERLDEHRTWGWSIINYHKFRMTASEEQRREKTRSRVAHFREKHQQKTTCNAPVTLCNAGNAMQRQRHKQKNNNPLPQNGDVVDTVFKSNSQSHNPPIANPPPIPVNLQTPEFDAAWEDWLRHLTEKRKKPTSLAIERQLKKLSDMGPQRAIAALEYSMEKNWQSIFEDAAAPVKERCEQSNEAPDTYKRLPPRPPQMAPAFPDDDTDE